MARYVAVVIVVLLIGVGAVSVWAMNSDSEALNDLLVDLELKDADAGKITGSGFIEVPQVTVSAEFAGEIAEVYVTEGDDVAAGDVLVRLESGPLEAQIRQAAAALEAAETSRARVAGGARPEEIRQAEAAVANAVAARAGAEQALKDALETRRDLQELSLSIDAARTEIDVLEQQLRFAEASLEAAEIQKARAERQLAAVAGPTAAEARLQLALAEEQWLQARLAAASAAVQLEGARIRLDDLRRARESPLALDGQVDAATAGLEAAKSAVDEAEAQLALIKAGAPQRERDLAAAAVRQAKARLKMLRLMLKRMTAVAPIDGTVIEIVAQEGENAVPGTALARVARLDPVELTIFVSETDMGAVEVGQRALLSVDAFENREFEGEVVYIASEAEFTPKNVQTKEDRAILVFAVRIRVPNADGDLKPGMPADATIETD